MSNKVVLDFGFDIGKVNVCDDANNSYLKLKIGKGTEDAMALKSVVEEGTGRTLLPEDHYVSIKVPEKANLDELKEMVEGMAGGEEPLIEEVAGKDGYKWLLISLKKANAEQQFGDINMLEQELSNFFEGVTANAFIEMYLKSSHHFTEATTVAQQNNEKDCTEGNNQVFPSIVTMGKDLSGHFKADIDHDFLIKTMDFAKKFCPVTPELFEFVRKMNNIECNLALNRPDELTGPQAEEVKSQMWGGLIEAREMFEDIKSFVSCLDDFRVFFTLKDGAYLSLEVKAPGLPEYVKYFAPDEDMTC